MVTLQRPIIRFLNEPITRPTDLIEPLHEPLRSAFVPYATGLLMNEMKSYMEWMSARGEFSWMNEDWEYVEDMYSFWPFMENSAGEPIDPYYYAYDPSIVCALVQATGEEFTVVGLVVLNKAPDLSLAEILETQHTGSGITRLNMTLVPLEMVDVPDSTLESVIYFWHSALRTLDWSTPRHRIDTLVFWSNAVRERMNEIISRDEVPATDEQDGYSTHDQYVPTQEDMLKVHGLYFPYPTYNDPIAASTFLADIKNQVPELSDEVTIEDISNFFSTGLYVPSIGSDPGVYYRLNAILCKYPEEIQERLYSGVGTSLDPRNVDRIGAGFNNGREPTREGQRLLTYEDLLQPRP